MKTIQTAILMMSLVNLFGCDIFGQNVRPGEQFTLKMNESAKIKGANIEITVDRIGRKWLANGGGEYLDFIFSVKHEGKRETYSYPWPDPLTAGDYKIDVVKTEPFGYGYAIFVVTKNDPAPVSETKPIEKNNANDKAAAKFVEQFGWHLDESITPTNTPIQFPKNFDGLPFYHYQIASKASGLDMMPLLDKRVEMLRYTLKEKLKNRGEGFTIYAHLIIENNKVVGAWQTDSSLSEPGIYSLVKK